MAENANESWRKPTNIQLLCLVLSTSSVQKAVSMNSEQFLSWRPNKKKNKQIQLVLLQQTLRPCINAGLTIRTQFSETYLY